MALAYFFRQTKASTIKSVLNFEFLKFWGICPKLTEGPNKIFIKIAKVNKRRPNLIFSKIRIMPQ